MLPAPFRARLSAFLSTIFVSSALVIALSSVHAQQFPDCSSAAADTDGDGWGWENSRSCVVVDKATSQPSAGSAQSGGSISFPTCRSAATDPDNDGYGYEDGRSCVVDRSGSQAQNNAQAPQQNNAAPNLPVCTDAGSDHDGDGYGWENNQSCLAISSSSSGTSPSSSDPQLLAARPGGAYTVENITDVVLVTGQSNVLASNTGYDANLDRPHSQVFAYTDSGWQVADLHQTWDRFQHPGNNAASTPGRNPTNNFAFHFGKSLVNKDVTRVAAFIVVPGPGKGISNWDHGTQQYRRIQDKVNRALADIPHKYTIDAVLWHQGENDWLYEGTADANPTGFTSEDSHEYRNYYQIKLNALINNFRNESWGSSRTAFICGETRRAEGVNRRLNALNHDNDPYTGCVKGTDLPKRADDPYGSHFSAEGLRTLGQRYADKYFELSSR